MIEMMEQETTKSGGKYNRRKQIQYVWLNWLVRQRSK
jgi:hypothetical protein